MKLVSSVALDVDPTTESDQKAINITNIAINIFSLEQG